MVPCDALLATANGITRLGGDWQSIVWPGMDEIVFVWYRSGVSIPALIEDTYKVAPPIGDYRVLYGLGEDPVLMLAPDYDGTFREIDRTLVHALSMGSVSKGKNAYAFNWNGLSFELGSNLTAIRETLVADYQLLILMHIGFVRELARRQEALVALVERIAASPNTSPLIAAMDRQSLKDAVEIANLLLPNMKRIKLA